MATNQCAQRAGSALSTSPAPRLGRPTSEITIVVIRTAPQPEPVGREYGVMSAFPEQEHGPYEDLRRAAVGSVAVSDTTEIRWFATGTPPQSLLRWFTRSETTGVVEERCDTYRVDGHPDIGVKWRHRTTLELKVRRSVGHSLELTHGLVGCTESWRKWSPADGLVAADRAGDHHVDVHKEVVRRFFAPSEEAGSPEVGGCHAEITTIRVAELDMWSVALAAFGTTESSRESIVAAWDALNQQDPVPSSLAESLEVCAGYPAWLSLIVLAGHRTLD